MLDLVEELKEGKIVYILLDSFKDLLYGKYKVINSEYQSVKNQSATLSLVDVKKKRRYFRKTYMFSGFRIEFDTEHTYFIYDNFDDLIRDFCKKMKKNPNKNIKLAKKLQNRYPNYF